MFEIVGREEQVFEQWEQGAKVSNPCMKAGDQVVFRSHGKVHATIAFEENGAVVADVPNFLLKEHGEIRVDLGWGLDGHIGCRTFFLVNKADKPAGYKCEDNASPDTRISFNDLKDRPFYEETEVLFDQTIEFANTQYKTSNVLPIAVGDTVNVTWDGTAYECVAIEVESGAIFVGNSATMGGANTGEPFAIAIVPGNGTMMLGDDGNHTVKIEVSKVKTIDPKYIPAGVGGGVVIVQDSAAASGIAVVESATPTATMNAAEIAEAVFAGKTVYFLEPNNQTLLPFVYGYRFGELASGVMTTPALADPYALFGATDESGWYYCVKVWLNGEYATFDYGVKTE